AGFLEARVIGEVRPAARHVHGQAGDPELLASARVEQAHLGDGEDLALAPDAIWGWVTQPSCRSISRTKPSMLSAAAWAFSFWMATMASLFSIYEKYSLMSSRDRSSTVTTRRKKTTYLRKSLPRGLTGSRVGADSTDPQ